MAFYRYNRGQTVGRFMHYLYDGYKLYGSDHWQFGGGQVLSGYSGRVVAEILPVDDPDDAPLFKFIGEYAHLNKIQEQKRAQFRLEEVRDIVTDGFEKYRNEDKDLMHAIHEKRLIRELLTEDHPDWQSNQHFIENREQLLKEKWEKLLSTIK